MTKKLRKIFIRYKSGKLTAEFVDYPSFTDLRAGRERKRENLTMASTYRLETVLKEASNYNFFLYPYGITVVARFDPGWEDGYVR